MPPNPSVDYNCRLAMICPPKPARLSGFGNLAASQSNDNGLPPSRKAPRFGPGTPFDVEVPLWQLDAIALATQFVLLPEAPGRAIVP